MLVWITWRQLGSWRNLWRRKKYGDYFRLYLFVVFTFTYTCNMHVYACIRFIHATCMLFLCSNRFIHLHVYICMHVVFVYWLEPYSHLENCARNNVMWLDTWIYSPNNLTHSIYIYICLFLYKNTYFTAIVRIEQRRNERNFNFIKRRYGRNYFGVNGVLNDTLKYV